MVSAVKTHYLQFRDITMKIKLSLITLACLSAWQQSALAETLETESAKDDVEIESIQVIGRSVSYANNESTQDMVKQQSAMTSILAAIDNLPGVLINEGDTFGSDDWSTTVSIRGFQISLDEQQVGITVDGIANGNSNYGGGAKANRYIDTENLGFIQVSQGTADIASRSNEALGGTLNFTSIDPTEDEHLLTSITLGDFDAKRYFMRYNSGEILGNTRLWFSASNQTNTDWVNQSAENKKLHIASKFISELSNDLTLKGYFSYDDAEEDNYQRVSKAQFETNPESDGLLAEWTGIPHIDQVYRKGWSTLRENTFAYLQADYASDNLTLSVNAYAHDNEGRGDWVPPYLVDVVNDAGNAETELTQQTVFGGASLGIFQFVDRDGIRLSPSDGCVSSLTFPYGVAGAEYDPDCYGPQAIPVGSYRHTHYGKTRYGINADASYLIQTDNFENLTRAGVWYEDYSRDEYRDWHKIIDSSSSFEFDTTPYWVQYDRSFTVDTMMFYLENEVKMDWITARVGAKKFFVELDRKDNFDSSNNVFGVDSDSDVLLSGGLVITTPVDGLEFFGGYAENFAAIKDTVLERPASALTDIEPETAENIDFGLRFSSLGFDVSLTAYNIDFENRLVFLPPDTPGAGIDFLIGDNGQYLNVGGIESEGLEASLSYDISQTLSIYLSYTDNESTYKSVPDAIANLLGIEVGGEVHGSVSDQFVVSLDWERNQYFAGLSTKYVGERAINSATTADAYTVSDAYLGVDVETGVSGIKNMQVRMTINNLFDENYLGGIAGQSAWIGAPRTAAVNLRFEF